MSYTKKTWASGDTVTSSALNNMEGGIDAAANPFIVTMTPTSQDYSGITDRSNEEVYDAYVAGRQIVAVLNSGSAVEILPTYVTVVEQNQEARVYGTIILNDMMVLAQMQFSGETTASYTTTIYPLTPMS